MSGEAKSRRPDDSRSGAAASKRRPLLSGSVFVGWAGVTIAELILPLRAWVALALTAVQTLAVPALTVVVLRLARRELQDADRDERRSHAVRAYVVHGVLVLLLAGCLFGKYAVIYELLERGADATVLASTYETYGVVAFLVVVLGLLGSPRRLAMLVATVADRPARLMAGSFGLAALVGTAVLALPISLQRVEDVSLLNALFNAMSAVCVTGLAVGNVAETYTPFGQGVLFVLFQMGGLGIMSLSTFFAVLAGQRLQARRAKAMAELLDLDSFAALRRSLLGLVTVTFVIEAVGAILLFIGLADHPEVAFDASESESGVAGAGSRVWAAVFHAVSAFCNAGFSNFRDGMAPFVTEHDVGGVIIVLIMVGGLGFPVMFELISRAKDLWHRRRSKNLSLHTRVVLVTSMVLWLAGALLFFVLERNGVMASLSWPDRIVAAIFQSVTCRTAGFSTVDFGMMGPASWMIACVLMFVGASPGSTGGGIKTTTMTVLFDILRIEARGTPAPELGGRVLTSGTVRRAIAVTFISVLVVGVLLFFLLVSESMDPARIAFEIVSAVSTTGLSTGITDDLSIAGKLFVTLGMFLGRIGPLTAALVMAEQQTKPRYRFVEERIAIG
jgi:trk system potassium uptake protein TrkH